MFTFIIQIRFEFEHLLDPQEPRKACAASILTFELPKEEFLNFQQIPLCQPSIISTALSKFCAVWRPLPPPAEDIRQLVDQDPDAFTYHKSIEFSSRIEPVSEDRFGKVLNRLQLQKPEWKESFTNLLHKLIQSKSVWIYEDAGFRPHGLCGFRLILLGDRRGCVFQAEIYSNFCGGPYANYVCGLG